VKKIVIASALSLGLLAPLTGHAASSTAGATIISPISISNTVGLQFGQIASSASAGTVTVDTTGSRSGTGGVTLVNGISVTAASFAVSGAPNLTYTFTLPTSTSIDLGSDSMTVDTFVANPPSVGTLDALGADTLRVGATLHVVANQPNGAYTGTFDVTVAYN
jgi:Domain of unknown function (DUF4402)